MHAVKPVEPYNGGEKSKAVGVGSGGGNQFNRAAILQSGGPALTMRLTSGPEQSFKPSFGVPQDKNRKKGCVRTPH
jgi:hypothetical protein